MSPALRALMASDERRRAARQSGGLAALAIMQAALLPLAGADEPEGPDLDLLEYLGSWQGDDEEWLAVSEWDAKSDAQGKEPEAPREEKDERPEPEKRKPPVGTRVVAELKQVDLTAEEARDVLRQLEAKLAGHSERRLTLEWRLYEPGEDT